MSGIQTDRRLIIAAARAECPVTADVAAFPLRSDSKAIDDAHKLVRPARCLYIANGHGELLRTHDLAKLPSGRPLQTAVHYRLQSEEPQSTLSPTSWLAAQLVRSSSNPEVLIVASEHYLPSVYMTILSALIARMGIRSFHNFGVLPRLIPCISPRTLAESTILESLRQLKDERERGLIVSSAQLKHYLAAKKLGQ